MALLIQARHLFYGLSMLDKYKGILGRFCNFRWHHRFFTPHSYRRHQLCHDCYVRRYLHGSVVERKESYIFITWTWNFFSLSPCIRTGLFYDSDHVFDYRLIDIITQKAWYLGSKKLLATSFRQMCFWKNEVAIKNTGGLLTWH